MGNDGRATFGQFRQRRGRAGAKVRETFAARRAVERKRPGRKRAKVGQVGEGHPFPLAEILFPQARVIPRSTTWPKRRRRVPAAPRGAGQKPHRHPRPPGRRRQGRGVRQVRRHVCPTRKPPAIERRRMADQHQFTCRGPTIHCRIPPSAPPAFLLCHPPMGMSILITGGARSGKSRIAEARALSFGPRAIYIATAEVRDDEMAARVAAHRARRGPEWQDAPAPFDLVQVLDRTDGGPARLVDCLTLWLTNLMLAERDWPAEARALCDCLTRQTAPVVLVTNEVGQGIVPDNRLARDFRDAAGTLNQQVAAVADEVVLAVAGLPLKVK